MRKYGLMIVVLCVLSIVGCAAKPNINSEKESSKKESKKKEKEQPKSEIEDLLENKPGLDETYTVIIYYSNDNADGLNSEEVEIESLTPQILMEELTKKEVITPDISVLRCSENYVEGEKTLDLDLTKSFSSYLANFGTAGEAVTIKAVCNTFLEAYDCKKIRITVEGELLATGHAEYPGYMSHFENN